MTFSVLSTRAPQSTPMVSKEFPSRAAPPTRPALMLALIARAGEPASRLLSAIFWKARTRSAYTAAEGESPTMNRGRDAARTTRLCVVRGESSHEDHPLEPRPMPGSAPALQADAGQTDLPTAHRGPAH